MNDFDSIVRAADKAIASGYVAGVTGDGRTVFHVLSHQGTLLQYWFTLDESAVNAPAGDPRQFDIRECADTQISSAVVHWSQHRAAVLA